MHKKTTDTRENRQDVIEAVEKKKVRKDLWEGGHNMERRTSMLKRTKVRTGEKATGELKEMAVGESTGDGKEVSLENKKNINGQGACL